MKDFEKIKYLFDNNHINIIKAELYHYIMKNALEVLIKNLLDYLDKDEIEPIINVIHNNYSEKKQDFTIDFDDDIKIYEDEYSINCKPLIKQLITYSSAAIYRADRQPSKNLINSKTPVINSIKKVLSDLVGVDISLALEANTKEEFINLLHKSIYQIPESFEEYNLKKLLMENDNNDDILGLKDFDEYLDLPDFLNSNYISNKKLNKSLFIEGLSGSGKTTLAQQVGYYISTNNSFYINLEKNTIPYKKRKDQINISLFLKALKHIKGILVIDNIGYSNSSKQFTKNILYESIKIELPIIIISQSEKKINLNNTIINTSDIFFNTLNDIKIKEDINFVKLHDTLICKSIMKNLIYYYMNRKIINNQPLNDFFLDKIANKYESLIYLKFTIEHTKNINSLSIHDSKVYIRKKYKEFFKENCKEFKFLFLAISSLSKGYRFKLPRKIFNQANCEALFIEKLVKKGLINKLDFNEYIELSFPHKIIPILIRKTLYPNIESYRKTLIKSLKFNSFKYKEIINHIEKYVFVIDNPLDKLLIESSIIDNEIFSTYNYLNNYDQSLLLVDLFQNNVNIKIIHTYMKKHLKMDSLFSEKFIFPFMINRYLSKQKGSKLKQLLIEFIWDNKEYFSENVKAIYELLINRFYNNSEDLEYLVICILNNKDDFLHYLKCFSWHLIADVEALYLLKHSTFSEFLNKNLHILLELNNANNLQKLEVYFFLKKKNLEIKTSKELALQLKNIESSDIFTIVNNDIEELDSAISRQTAHLNNDLTYISIDYIHFIFVTLIQEQNQTYFIEFLQERLNTFNSLFAFDYILSILNFCYSNHSKQFDYIDQIYTIINEKLIIPVEFEMSANIWLNLDNDNIYSFRDKVLDVICKNNLLDSIENKDIKSIENIINITNSLFNYNSKNFDNLYTYSFKVIIIIILNKYYSESRCLSIIIFLSNSEKYKKEDEINEIMHILNEYDINQIITTLREMSYLQYIKENVYNSQDDYEKFINHFLKIKEKNIFSNIASNFLNEVINDLNS